MDQSLKDLYEFYWEIKASIALYEVKFNAIPADLLNEIRNTFDHIARCYRFYGLGSDVPNVEAIKRHLSKARSHLERLHLDLYKLFILENVNQIDRFSQRIDNDLVGVRERPYPLPDVTQFQSWFYKERKIVDGVVVAAKNDECTLEDHDRKIELLVKARDCQEEFIDRLCAEYGTVQPYIREAAEIAQRDRRRYRRSTYIVPIIIAAASLFVGVVLGKLF